MLVMIMILILARANGMTIPAWCQVMIVLQIIRDLCAFWKWLNT